MPKIGNGVCNCEYNNEWWGYDGGDCCPESCRRPSLSCYTASGTITASKTSNIVTGVGSSFQTQFGTGHKVYAVNANGVGTFIGTVASIQSATMLTLTTSAKAAVSASAYAKDQNKVSPNAGCTAQDVKCDLSVSGTISTKDTTGAIAGSGTYFLKWFAPGHTLYTASGVAVGVIASITSDVVLTLTTAPNASLQSALLAGGVSIKLDQNNSPFLGYNCKQPGCRPTASSSPNVGAVINGRTPSNWIADGHTAKTFQTCSQVQVQ